MNIGYEPENLNIYIFSECIDMRRQLNGLLGLVEGKYRMNPFGRYLFVFVNKGKDKIKALKWDENGFVIYYKRLEKGRFRFPGSKDFKDGNLEISAHDLRRLLYGLDMESVLRKRRYISMYILPENVEILTFSLVSYAEKRYNIYMKKNELERKIRMDISSMTKEELDKTVVDLTVDNYTLKTKVEWFEEQFRLDRARKYGASSEKNMSDSLQMSLFNEPELIADSCDDTTEPEFSKVIPPKKKKSKGRKDRITANFPKTTIEFCLPEEKQYCPVCGSRYVKVKKNIRKELEIIPAQVKVVEYVDQIFACRKCQQTGDSNPMHSSGAPKGMFRNSLASPSLVADIMTKKYMSHIPLDRQEKKLHRNGINLYKQTLSDWVIRALEKYLTVVYDLFHTKLQQRDIVQADETVVQAAAMGSGG